MGWPAKWDKFAASLQTVTTKPSFGAAPGFEPQNFERSCETSKFDLRTPRE